VEFPRLLSIRVWLLLVSFQLLTRRLRLESTRTLPAVVAAVGVVRSPIPAVPQDHIVLPEAVVLAPATVIMMVSQDQEHPAGLDPQSQVDAGPETRVIQKPSVLAITKMRESITPRLLIVLYQSIW
jgi:hypothetical protein